MKKSFLFRLSLGLLGMGVLFCADRSVAEKEGARHVKLGELDFELEKICTLHDGSNQYRIVGEGVRTITADTDKDEDLQKHVRRKITQCFLRRNRFAYVPYAQQKGDITADYGVFEQYITDMFGCKKEDLGDGYCLYKDDKKRQKMIICKKDDEGFSFMFNFKKGNIESECFTKLDATSRDFIFHSGKNSALQKNNNSFPVTFAGFCKDNQYRTLFRNDNGRLDIKTQPVDGGMFDGSDYFYGSKHSNNRRGSRGNGELRRLLMKYRRIKGMEDYCTNFFRWRKNSI